MFQIITIIILGIVIIGLLVERFLYTKEMNKQLEKANLSVMSRNINEYLSATAEKPKKQEFRENDEVDLGEASDEDFMSAINKQTK